MAEKLLTIPKNPVLDSSEDYLLLRKEGLKLIEKLSGKIWTDYNLHDPGITTHELLCYAITDLGYRASHSVPDLLAPDPENDFEKKNDILNFFTAKQILPVNPCSETDIRKAIMDVPGIKNAWLNVANDYEQAVYIDRENCELSLKKGSHTVPLPITGLYNVLIQFEDDSALKEQYDAIRYEVRRKLMRTRNLCEDYLSITQVQYEDIAVCSDIEVRPSADVTLVQAKIYQLLINYFSPLVSFYTLEEMIDKGKTIDEIFEGPLLKSGFIDDEELEKADLRTQLHTSDLYNLIMDIPEVVAVKTLKLIRYVNGVPTGEEEEWTLDLGGFRAARLEKAKSKFIFYKGVLPYMAKLANVEEELAQLQEVQGVFRKKGHRDDLDIPAGTFRNISDYYPVQNDFPLTYGIGTAGLPKNAGAERKAQALQMKAYLLFFEQLLSDYFAQLSNIKRIFSYGRTIDRDKVDQLVQAVKNMAQEQVAQLKWSDFGIDSRTYFTQPLNEIADFNLLLKNPATYENDLLKISETAEVYSDRRNRFLNHLLARFCEDMTEYSLTLFQMYNKLPKGELLAGLRLAADKEALLHDYARLSRDRGKAFNYKPGAGDEELQSYDTGVWDTENISGLKLRVARLLGMSGDKANDLALKCLKSAKTSAHTIILYKSDRNSDGKKNSDDDILMRTVSFWNHLDALGLLENILRTGTNAANFIKVDGAGEFSFQLTDPVNGAAVLAQGNTYSTKTERNEALKTTIKVFTDKLAVKSTTIKRQSYFKITLFDQDLSTVLLEAPAQFTKQKEAEARFDEIIFSAQDESSFVKYKDTGKFCFRLLDSCNANNILAESLKFLTEGERDLAFESTLKLFAEDRRLDVIRRRDLATTLLDIHYEGGTDLPWSVVLINANKPEEYLLQSESYDTKECAESVLLYILHNGDNPAMYKVIDEAGKYTYALYDDCENQIASGEPSGLVATKEEAQLRINCIVRFFHENCDIENFHLIEHILLRPRTNLDALLPACVDCGQVPRRQNAATTGHPRFEIEIYKLKDKLPALTGHDWVSERMRDIIASQKSNSQIKSLQKNNDRWGYVLKDAAGIPVLYSEGFVELNSCTNSVASLRENGVNTSIEVRGAMRYGNKKKDIYMGNYRVFPRKGNYYFHLYADNAQLIAQSALHYDTPEDAVAAIHELVTFLAFEDNILPVADACPGNDEDPYSMRLSVILPAWPTRFRSQYFRKYIEKVIRLETPAHIYPKICWVDLEQMRNFEYYYRRWLQTLLVNDVPNPNTVRLFIDAFVALKNVYPVAVLHDCEDVNGDEPQVILDNTMLGNL